MTPINIKTWIAENESNFVPPVCNKCMFSDQLKVFYVGGPNSRKDYHLEEGEEFFYQRKGDMVLKVLEHGVMKDVVVHEGEMFLLPSRVEHSPQRFENSIGFVVERDRANTEFDCVRYFCPDTTERLFERWFHLKDVVKDLPPLIKGFLASDQAKTGIPGPDSFIVHAPYEPRDISLMTPVNLNEFIEANKERIKNGSVKVFEDYFTTDVNIMGVGEHRLESKDKEILLWALENTSAELYTGASTMIQPDSKLRIPPGITAHLRIATGYVMSITMQ